MAQPEPGLRAFDLYAGVLHAYLDEHPAHSHRVHHSHRDRGAVRLFLGWSKTFREFVFPVFETLRPIPVLAWVPLAIVMFKGMRRR